MLVPPASRSSDQIGDGGLRTHALISVVVPVYKEEREHPPVPGARRSGAGASRQLRDRILPRSVAGPHRGGDPRRRARATHAIGLLVFSRRFGQPAATMAGILNCRGALVRVIDVDLQDPPEMIETLLRKAQEGFDVVTARRSIARGRDAGEADGIALSAIGLINRIAEVTIPRNTGDFRVMSRRVVEELRGLSESHGFLRGLVALVGFRADRGALRARRAAHGHRQLQPLSRLAEDRLQRHHRILHRSAAAHDVDGVHHRAFERLRHPGRDRH